MREQMTDMREWIGERERDEREKATHEREREHERG